MNIYRYYFTKKLDENYRIELPKEIVEYIKLKKEINLNLYTKDSRIFIDQNIDNSVNVLNMDEECKITIPKPIINDLKIKKNQKLNIFLVEDKISIKKPRDHRIEFI